MSAPLKMDAGQAAALGRFLELLNAATAETGCHLQPYGQGQIELPLAEREPAPEWASLQFSWDATAGEYVIDERVGQ